MKDRNELVEQVARIIEDTPRDSYVTFATHIRVLAEKVRALKDKK